MSRRTAVLISFGHALGGSGIGRTAAAHVRELALAGADVTVVAASLDPAARVPDGVRVHTTLSLRGQRVPHRALGSVDRALAWHDLRASQLVTRLGPRLDVVHGWPGAGRRTFAAARRAGVPSVREVPNTHTANAYAVVDAEMARLGLPIAPGNSHALNPQRLAVEEIEYESATALLCPAESVARSFRDRGFADRRLLRTQYGYWPEPALRDTRVPGDRDPLRLVFVGRCEPRKGLHFALDAWIASGIADQGGTFDIYGTFYPGYEELLGRRLRATGVQAHGFSRDIAARMGAADALTLPSLEEGSALVTYEAQAAGCALLVSDEAGAVCEPGVHGLVHPAGDVAALTRDLRALATNRPRLERMRAAAAAHADALTWGRAAHILLARYDEARALARA